MLPKSICVPSKVKETMFFMPKRIYEFHSFTSDFDWRSTFVTNAIQIAFPLLIKWRLLFVVLSRWLDFCRKYDFWRRAEGTARWRKLTRPSLGISNPISVKFLTDDATWKFSRGPASEKFEAILLSCAKEWASTSVPAKFLCTQRQQVRNFAFLIIDLYQRNFYLARDISRAKLADPVNRHSRCLWRIYNDEQRFYYDKLSEKSWS